MARSFDPPEIWSPFGAFSQSVIADGGRIVFLKGQVALNAEGRLVGEGHMAKQLEQVLLNIAGILRPMGGRLSDVVSLSQFTTDIAAFMQCGELRSSYFQEPFPVTTTLEVSSLYDPRLLVEITAIAEIPLERFSMPAGARQMGG